MAVLHDNVKPELGSIYIAFVVPDDVFVWLEILENVPRRGKTKICVGYGDLRYNEKPYTSSLSCFRSLSSILP